MQSAKNNLPPEMGVFLLLQRADRVKLKVHYVVGSSLLG
jgi:hypothetical protein